MANQYAPNGVWTFVSGSPGTGDVTFAAALPGYFTPAQAGAVNGDTYPYCIREGTKVEIGRGTYNSSGTTFTRNTVILSSAGGTTKETFTSAAHIALVTIREDFLPATAAQVWGGIDNINPFTSKSLQDANAWVAVAYAATVTLDFATGFKFDIGALTGNLTLANPTNIKVQSGSIRLPQDTTGGRILTLGNKWKAPGGAKSLSTGADKVDLLVYDVYDSNTIYYNLMKDMS